MQRYKFKIQRSELVGNTKIIKPFESVIMYKCLICGYAQDWDEAWDETKKAEVQAEVDAHHNEHFDLTPSSGST